VAVNRRIFVLVLSRKTVLVLDRKNRFDQEHEHHFIEHEHERKRTDVGKVEASSL
jgi:hypothetical protein